MGRLLDMASEMEETRDHVIGPPEEPDLIEEFDTRERSEPDPDAGTWQAVASDAILGEVIDTYAPLPSDGGLFALDGLLSPEQERALLARDEKIRAEQARRVASARRASKASKAAEERQARRDDLVALQRRGGSVYDTISDPREMRREIHRALLDYSRHHDLTPQAGWGQLYREVPGPKNESAPMDLLRTRLEWLHSH